MMTIDIDAVDYDENGRALVDDQFYTGEVVERDATGRERSLSTYRDGWQEGPERRYFPDGTPEFEGDWTYGRQTGHHRYWHANGRLAEEIAYDDLGNATRLGRWTAAGTPD